MSLDFWACAPHSPIQHLTFNVPNKLLASPPHLSLHLCPSWCSAQDPRGSTLLFLHVQSIYRSPGLWPQNLPRCPHSLCSNHNGLRAFAHAALTECKAITKVPSPALPMLSMTSNSVLCRLSHSCQDTRLQALNHVSWGCRAPMSLQPHSRQLINTEPCFLFLFKTPYLTNRILLCIMCTLLPKFVREK